MELGGDSGVALSNSHSETGSVVRYPNAGRDGGSEGSLSSSAATVVRHQVWDSGVDVYVSSESGANGESVIACGTHVMPVTKAPPPARRTAETGESDGRMNVNGGKARWRLSQSLRSVLQVVGCVSLF